MGLVQNFRKCKIATYRQVSVLDSLVVDAVDEVDQSKTGFTIKSLEIPLHHVT